MESTCVAKNLKRSSSSRDQSDRRWCDHLSFDDGRVVQLLQDHRDQILRKIKIPIATAQYSVTTKNPASSFQLENNGEYHGIAGDLIDEFEEIFGEEALMDNMDRYYDVLSGYFDPHIDANLAWQWISLWIATDQNEFVLLGILGEQKLIKYSIMLDATSSSSSTGIVLHSNSTSSAPQEHTMSPTKFTLLHRDSSGECVCHGECAVFISVEDDCADLIHDQTGLPMYLIPIVYGTYSMVMGLTWRTPIDSLLMLDLIQEIQRVMKKGNAKDNVLRH